MTSRSHLDRQWTMPHQTFFNLPDEKRNQILEIAIDEFADNDYDSASVSRIVARAGIAKGSFYQYFADKEDLHVYLLGMLVEAKTQFLSLDQPDPAHVGIFAYLRWMAEEAVAFELAYPRLTRIGVRAMNLGRLPKAFDAAAREATAAFYGRLVEVGKQQGDLAPTIDPELAAVIFDAILTNLSRYILQRVAPMGITPDEDSRALFELPEVTDMFTQAIDILEHGMAAR